MWLQSIKSFIKKIVDRIFNLFKQKQNNEINYAEGQHKEEEDKPKKRRISNNRFWKLLPRFLLLTGQTVKSGTHCWCGTMLKRNNSRQVVFYCCKEHRRLRHNKRINNNVKSKN